MPSTYKLQVGSFLVYPSRGTSEASAKAKQYIKIKIKQDQGTTLSYVASRLSEEYVGSELEGLLTQAGVLVPTPRSTPTQDGWLWPAHRISQELLNVKIGESIEAILERTHAVTRSSGKSVGHERPSTQKHLETIAIKPRLINPSNILIVDDVVTRGATLMACYLHLRKQFPNADINAFAVARVESDVDFDESREMMSPKLQSITYDGNDVWRR